MIYRWFHIIAISEEENQKQYSQTNTNSLIKENFTEIKQFKKDLRLIEKIWDYLKEHNVYLKILTKNKYLLIGKVNLWKKHA